MKSKIEYIVKTSITSFILDQEKKEKRVANKSHVHYESLKTPTKSYGRQFQNFRTDVEGNSHLENKEDV